MNDFTVVSPSLVGANPGTTWQVQGDGAAAYQIGSGFTVPLSGNSVTPGTRVASLAAPSSLSQVGGHFANNGFAMPHNIDTAVRHISAQIVCQEWGMACR